AADDVLDAGTDLVVVGRRAALAARVRDAVGLQGERRGAVAVEHRVVGAVVEAVAPGAGEDRVGAVGAAGARAADGRAGGVARGAVALVVGVVAVRVPGRGGEDRVVAAAAPDEVVAVAAVEAGVVAVAALDDVVAALAVDRRLAVAATVEEVVATATGERVGGGND